MHGSKEKEKEREQSKVSKWRCRTPSRTRLRNYIATQPLTTASKNSCSQTATHPSSSLP